MPFVAIYANYQKPPPENRYTLGFVVLFSFDEACVWGAEGIHFQVRTLCCRNSLGCKSQDRELNWPKRVSEGSGSILEEAKEELGDRLGGGRLPGLCWPPASPSPSWLPSPLLQPTRALRVVGNMGGRSSIVALSILVTAHSLLVLSLKTLEKEFCTKQLR